MIGKGYPLSIVAQMKALFGFQVISSEMLGKKSKQHPAKDRASTFPT